MKSKALIAEFISTFALVFFGAGSIIASSYAPGAAHLLAVAFAHGLALVVMITATAAISGGHVNPAVTIGLWITGNIDSKNAIGYIFSQCLGAITAALFLSIAFPAGTLQTPGLNLGTPALGNGIDPLIGLMTEAVMTFFLMFVVYGTAVDPRGGKVPGVFIGLTVTICILIGGPLTGAAMNPARYFGPALVSGSLDYCWLYWIGPVIGAICAALLYKNCLAEKKS